MKILNSMYRNFLKIFGDIKIFPWPMFIIYNPEGYGVKGEEVRDIINQIQPGDILIRGYKRYLDGYFIPGFFSHAAIVVNDNMIIHSMAEGVFKQDIINFCRCDYMAILRFKKGIEVDTQQFCKNAENLLGAKYDFEFEDGDDEYYCTELVYQVCQPYLKLQQKEIKMFKGLISKKSFTPDQFWDHKDLIKVYYTNLVKEHYYG